MHAIKTDTARLPGDARKGDSRGFGSRRHHCGGDDEALKALRTLEAAETSRSDAILWALLSAARRLRGQELAAEVAALGDDEEDRQEMLEVAGFMEALRAAG